MRFFNYIFIVALCLTSWSCRKTEPGTALPNTTQTYTPPGYDPKLFHYAKHICDPFLLKDIVIDSLDKTQAYMIGNFTDGSVINVPFAMGIVKFNSSTNSFSSYSTNVTGTQGISTFFQSSSGLQYIGGYFDMGTTSGNFGFKQPTNSTITPINGLNGKVNVMKEQGNDVYFAGDFYQYNTGSATNILFCDKTNHAPINQYGGSVSNLSAIRLEYFQNTWYYLNQNSQYVYLTNGTVSSVASFNGPCRDLLVANGKLYLCGEMSGFAVGNPALNFVCEYNGTSWAPTGNKLTLHIYDMEYHDNTLYASAYGGVCYLDTSSNTWKDALQGLNVSFSYIKLIRFIGDKLYVYDNNEGLYELTH